MFETDLYFSSSCVQADLWQVQHGTDEHRLTAVRLFLCMKKTLSEMY